MEITLTAIGIIHSPYLRAEDVPAQGALELRGEGSIEVFPEYAEGLDGIEGFSHLIVLYYLHKSKGYSLLQNPHGRGELRGVFSIRSPHRPNPIGFSVMILLERKANILRVSQVDALDGTPLLDIKPYIPRIDSYPNARPG